ncbi:hypothetical protein BX666DRAFT_1878546 [Dichotomocladium elegans]|nr:hypothetical protein BX666DRAFT_1878546 [Dichotomocladium elegans]
MVSFQCDNCCDVVKKPKLDQHRQRCRATFTCIDCSTTFQHLEYKSHTSCISEAEKYQKSLYRKKGNNNKQQQQQKKNVEEKPKETNTNKPLSLIDELKQKKNQQQDTSSNEPTKRKAEEVKDENKKKQKKGKWEEAELPLDNKAKVVQLALQEVLSKATTAMPIKDCRKKVVKLVASHPKASKKLSKSDVKDVFDESLLLGMEGETLVIKTA